MKSAEFSGWLLDPPNDEELAAIVTAFMGINKSQKEKTQSNSKISQWRFSGRHWAKPALLVRSRPWTGDLNW
jgi:hypothetical protein